MIEPGSQSNPDDRRYAVFFASLFGACVGIAIVIHLSRSGAIVFSYPGNPLGIRSLVHLNRYPFQQDIFWYIFGMGLPLLLSAITAFSMKRNFLPEKLLSSGPWLWSLGIFLPNIPLLTEKTWLGRPLSVLHVLALIALPFIIGSASKADSAGKPLFAAPAEVRAPSEGCDRREIVLRYALPIVLLFILYWNPSYLRFKISWTDAGQHFAWLDAMTRGRWPGAETAMKYGPLLEWVIYGLWRIKGMTIGSFDWVSAVLQFAGAFIALIALIKFTRSRWAPYIYLVFILPHNVLLHISQGQFRILRGAFPLVSILFLGSYFRDRRPIWAYLSGMFAAISVGISLEFGVFGLVGLVGGLFLDWLHRRPLEMKSGLKGILILVCGAASVALTFFLFYAAHGSLHALIFESGDYARAFASGYGVRPFPGFPWWDASNLKSIKPPFTQLIMYVPPPIYLLCGVELISRFTGGRWNTEASKRAALLLFGVAAYRVALGRSDWYHMSYSSFAAGILFVWEFEAGLSLVKGWWRAGRRRAGFVFPTAYLILAAVAALLISMGVTAHYWNHQKGCLEGWRTRKTPEKWLNAGWVPVELPESGGAWISKEDIPRLYEITDYIKTHTSPGEPIFVIPDHGIFYFLAHCPSASRFDLAMDAVTAAQRREVARELMEKKPMIIFFDDRYIDLRYEVEHREEMAVINKYYRQVDTILNAKIYVPK